MPVAPRSSPSIPVSALLLAATGFTAGFFGPIALNPEANQGPLLGIFITGPGGALLGVILGVLFRLLPIPPAHAWRILYATCVVGGLTILYFCLPQAELRG